MIHWGWLVAAVVISICFTVLVFNALIINEDDTFEELT